MKFGVMEITSCVAGDDPATAFEGWLGHAALAEELGFWSMWSTEHHFGSDRSYRPYGVSAEEFPTTDYDMAPDPMTLLTYLAARTARLRVGTAVSILHWDHPIRVLEQAAMLDVLSGGRLELGVGRGVGFRETQVFDVPVEAAENQRKFREMVEIIQRGWSGEEFDFSGEYFKFPKLILAPCPRQQPAPIWVGSASDEGATWAAERGLPYATTPWPIADIPVFAKRRRLAAEAAAAAGHDPASMSNPHFFYMYCGETDEQAAEVAYEYMTRFRHILEGHYEWERGHAENAVAGAGNEANVDVHEKAMFVIDRHIVGSPETCIERIDLLQREIGLDYIVCIVGFGAMPHDVTERSLARFGERVLPYFAAESPQPALVS